MKEKQLYDKTLSELVDELHIKFPHSKRDCPLCAMEKLNKQWAIAIVKNYKKRMKETGLDIPVLDCINIFLIGSFKIKESDLR